MTEQQTPVMEKPVVDSRATPPVDPSGAPAPSGKRKKKKSHLVRNIIIAVVVLAVLVAAGIFIYLKVFKQTDEKGTAMTDFVSRGSIQSVVEGSGTTKAKDSATVTPVAGGTVLELFVKEGDQVTAGQQLYSMDDSAARKAVVDAEEAVTSAQKAVTNSQKELQAIYDSAKDLIITAPHAGKLMDVATFKVGDDVDVGAKVATLVNDTKLRLSLYYSYTYENQISVGQKVEVSLPSIMGSRSGTVEKINYVRRVVPEGSVTFEVIFVLDNPGTLTEKMDASVSMTAGDGSPIYPYETGKLEYYETTAITAKTKGPVEFVNLINYGDVKAGQRLVQLGAEDNAEQLAAKENALKAAQDKLDEAVKTLEEKRKELVDQNAVAPLSGTVLSCSLTAGAKAENGQGVTIADTTVMTVEISVDERNIGYVKPGMMVNIDQWGTMFMGIVESVSQTAKGENGVASFPAIVKVDNADGTLMSGMYVSYNFVASQSDNTLVVPVQAVKYVSFTGVGGGVGEPGMMPEGDGGMTDPGAMPEGGETTPPTDGLDETVPPTDTPDETTAPEGDGAVDGGGDIDIGGSIDSGVSTGGSVSMPAPGGDIAVMPMPRNYQSGAFANPLMAIARPGGGGSISIGGGGSGSSGSDSTGTIVFVKADKAPENAIAEPDPTWECPAGFFAVPVTVGLADNSRVEILSGLNEGDEVFIGYETQQASNWG